MVTDNGFKVLIDLEGKRFQWFKNEKRWERLRIVGG